MIKKRYQETSKKLIKNKKIFLISDLHIGIGFNIKKLDKIKKEIEKEIPNYICIPGDIIDNTNIIKDKEDIVINFLKDISTNTKVIISLGNHDVCRLIRDKKGKRWEYDKRDDFFNKIRNIKNVYLLENEIYTDKDICFIGLSLSYEYYKTTGESINILEKELNALNIKIDKNKYNVLLCHSPHRLTNERIIKTKIMKDIDLILSGHMHNGMVHPIMELIWKGNKGIITPTKELFPKAKVTRGRIKLNDKNLIISGGITKLSNSSAYIISPLNCLYPMNIEIININN